MNFGQNLLTWVTEQAQPLFVVAIIGMGLWFILSRKVSILVATIIVAIVGGMFVFNPWGIADLLVNIGSNIFGVSSRPAFVGSNFSFGVNTLFDNVVSISPSAYVSGAFSIAA